MTYRETGTILGGEFSDGKPQPCLCDCCQDGCGCATTRKEGVWAHVLLDNADAELAKLPVTITHNPGPGNGDVGVSAVTVFTEPQIEAATENVMKQAGCQPDPAQGRCLRHDCTLVTANQCQAARLLTRAALDGLRWHNRDTNQHATTRPTPRLDKVIL